MQTDSQLLTEFITTKDPKAFEEIVARHQKMVYSTCFKILKNPADAQDASQATFLALIKKAGSLKNQNLLSYWLHKMAIWVSKNLIKTNVRLRAREEQYAMENNNISVQDLMLLEEKSEILQEAISALPEKYASPIIAHYFEARPIKEIAEGFGVPDNTISKQLSRGLEKLRKKLIKKGLAGISTGILIKYLGTSTAEAVPTGLTTSLCALATTGPSSAVVSATATTAVTAMEVAKIKIIIASVIGAAIIGAGGYEVAKIITSDNNKTPEPAIKTEIPKNNIKKDVQQPLQIQNPNPKQEEETNEIEETNKEADKKLFQAVHERDIEGIEKALNMGADINVKQFVKTKKFKTTDHGTPLYAAI